MSNETTRLVACVAFSGDLHPTPNAAAVVLARQGFEVALLPEKYRPRLADPLDDFLECFRRVPGDAEAVAKALDVMTDEVDDAVDSFGGLVIECGIVASDYTADFCGLIRDDRAAEEASQQT